MGDSHVGLQARLMSQALRKLAGTLNRTDTICIFTNQLREKIGVMFGNPETTPGGRALKFYASVRLDIRRIETLKDGAEAFGNRVRVKVAKNKVAPPFKQAEFDIIYGSGIPWEGTVLDVGLETKVVQKAGSYFSFGDERLGQGRQNATSFLSENPDLVQQILARIQAEAPEDQIISARAAALTGGGGSRDRDRGRGAGARSSPPARADGEEAARAGAPGAASSRSQRDPDRSLPRSPRDRRDDGRCARHARPHGSRRRPPRTRSSSARALAERGAGDARIGRLSRRRSSARRSRRCSGRSRSGTGARGAIVDRRGPNAKTARYLPGKGFSTT